LVSCTRIEISILGGRRASWRSFFSSGAGKRKALIALFD